MFSLMMNIVFGIFVLLFCLAAGGAFTERGGSDKSRFANFIIKCLAMKEAFDILRGNNRRQAPRRQTNYYEEENTTNNNYLP